MTQMTLAQRANGVALRGALPSAVREGTLEIAAGGRSVAHNVLSHLVKPVAPRRLLDEVEVALGSGEQK
jgi:hypothetical protein